MERFIIAVVYPKGETRTFKTSDSLDLATTILDEMPHADTIRVWDNEVEGWL